MKIFILKLTVFFSSVLIIIGITAGGISNYRAYSFFIKAIISFLAILILFFFIRKDKTDFLSLFKFNSIEKILTVAFIIYMGLSVLWSWNREFGLEKYFIFISSPVVLSVFLLFCFNKWGDEFIKSCYWVLIISGCATGAFVLAFYPFRFDEASYSFEIGRWSHVIYGRFIGSVFLIYFLSILFYPRAPSPVHNSFSVSNNSVNPKIQNSRFIPALLLPLNHFLIWAVPGFFITLFGFTVYFSGLRFSLLSLTLIIMMLFLNFLIKKELNLYRTVLIFFALAVLLIPFFFKLHPHPEQVARYENLNYKEVVKDVPLAVRLNLMEKAFVMFRQNPVFGVGLGGFKNDVLGEEPLYQKYPHNILFEIGTELGSVGLILFILLIFFSFRLGWKYYPAVFFFMLYALALSMMSKDISSNVLLWVPLLFIMWKPQKIT